MTKAVAIKPMETYDLLGDAFAFFNKELFAGKLSNCLIILHRHRSAYGYFHASHMAGMPEEAKKGSKAKAAKKPTAVETPVHEIALNPKHIRVRKPIETLATLVHEMVHQQQQEHGKPPKAAYHNKQWAAWMKLVGLHPSDTGKPGGAETGRYVSHYIVDGGPFAKAFAAFEKKHPLKLFGDLPQIDAKKQRTSKFKFMCPNCEQCAWAKEGAELVCGAEDCDGAEMELQG